MPRVTYMSPAVDKELAADIRRNYGGMLNLTAVAKLLNRHRDTARKFMDGVPAYNINGRRYWSATDVARRLMEVRTCRVSPR